MSDLREKLAARLKAIAFAKMEEQDARINTRGAISEHYEAMADECIRQMEWAKRDATEPVFDKQTQESIGQWNRGEYGAGARTILGIIKRDVRARSLAAAPDDWKPE